MPALRIYQFINYDSVSVQLMDFIHHSRGVTVSNDSSKYKRIVPQISERPPAPSVFIAESLPARLSAALKFAGFHHFTTADMTGVGRQ